MDFVQVMKFGLHIGKLASQLLGSMELVCFAGVGFSYEIPRFMILIIRALIIPCPEPIQSK
jgi:hypothetical protein